MGLVVGSAPEVERDTRIERISLAELRTYTRAISYAEAKTIAMFKRPGSGLVRADQVVTGLLKSKNYKAGESGSLFNLDTGYFETTNGKFRGELEAATGSFKGSLEAATGSFKGSLEAATGSFSGELNAAVIRSAYEDAYGHLDINENHIFYGYARTLTTDNTDTPLCYLGDDLYLVKTVDDYVKIKNLNDYTWAKTRFGNENATKAVYIGDGTVIISHSSEQVLYLSDLNTNLKGTVILNERALNFVYIGNRELLYVRYNDGNKIYKKSIDNNNPGVCLNWVYQPIMFAYVPNNKVVYFHNSADKIYLKDIDETGLGDQIADTAGSIYTPSNYMEYIGNNRVVYHTYTASDNKPLFIIKTDGSNVDDEGAAILSGTAPLYVGKGRMYFKQIAYGDPDPTFILPIFIPFLS